MNNSVYKYFVFLLSLTSSCGPIGGDATPPNPYYEIVNTVKFEDSNLKIKILSYPDASLVEILDSSVGVLKISSFFPTRIELTDSKDKVYNFTCKSLYERVSNSKNRDNLVPKGYQIMDNNFDYYKTGSKVVASEENDKNSLYEQDIFYVVDTLIIKK
jgi:hypothetical protein